MSWKKKILSTASLEQAAVRACKCSEPSSASQGPERPSFGQTLKMFKKKMRKQKRRLEASQWGATG